MDSEAVCNAFAEALSNGDPAMLQQCLQVHQELINKQLLVSIRQGDLSAVKKCIDEGADVNQRVEGRSPLCRAIKNGERDITLELVQHGADITFQSPDATDAEHDQHLGKVERREAVANFGLSSRTREVKLSKRRTIDEQAESFWDSLNSGGWTSAIMPMQSGRKHISARKFPANDPPQPDGENVLNTLIDYGGDGEQIMLDLMEVGFIAKNHITSSDQGTRDRVSKVWFWAARRGHTKTVSKLLDLGMDIDQFSNRVDSHGSQTALNYAAGAWQPEVVDILLKHGADVSGCMRRRIPGVHTYPGDDTQPLIKVCHFLEKRLERQKTGLHIIRSLLQQGACVNAVDYERRTPLIYATMAGSWEAVELLISLGAKIDLVDCEGRSALHYAGRMDHTGRICQLLLRKCSKEIVNQQDLEGNTPLIEAVGDESNVPVVKYLLAAGADVNMISKTKGTALQNASRFGTMELLKLLVDSEADVNLCGSGQFPPLSLVCGRRNDLADHVAFLVEKGANVRHVDFLGRSILHVLMRNGVLNSGVRDILQATLTLVLAGADVNAEWTDDRLSACQKATPVGLASEMLPLVVVYLLCVGGADPNGVGFWGPPAFHTICGKFESKFNEMYELVEFMLDRGASIIKEDEEGCTALHHAAKVSNFAALKAMFLYEKYPMYQEAMVAIHWKNKLGQTPLHLACSTRPPSYEGCATSLRRIIDSFAQRDTSISSSQCLQYLLYYGADVTDQDSNGSTALHYAARAKNPMNTIALLLLRGQALLRIRNGLGQLPIHEAALKGSLEVMKILISFEESGETGHREYIDIAVVRNETNGTDNRSDEEVLDSYEAYWKWWAASLTIERYLSKDYMPARTWNARDILWNTPLHYAAAGGSLDVVQFLLKHSDINPDILNRRGETPFDLASENREVALSLLPFRRDGAKGSIGLDACGSRGRTLLPRQKKQNDIRKSFMLD
ncbi:ankyrin repeat-containing domain protein [Rhexocercosporidium sp. MPI-PUGE-AT-0058]|nr:ankyrin repeat-containing domain protein [Rhexocercosporidium sp. MPI-PUGE-AT-0058]